jgi:hypothetical protein
MKLNTKIPGIMTYMQYRELIDTLLAQEKTTGGEQTPETLEYAKLNVQRMKRIDTTVDIGDALRHAVQAVSRKQTWFVITEGWCGDAAQNVPMLAKAAALNPHITFRLILRDEHLDVMDRFLTNGTRSIPIMAIVSDETQDVLAVWGPRPASAQAIVAEVKKNPSSTKEEMLTALHGWYAKDRTASAQQELARTLERLQAVAQHATAPTTSLQ